MKLKRLLILALMGLLLPMLLIACGGDDEEDDNGDNGDTTEAESDDGGVSLGESVTLEGTVANITVSAPEGWSTDINTDMEQIVMGNSDAVIEAMNGTDAPAPEAGQQGIGVLVLPSMMMGESDTIMTLAESMTSAGEDEATAEAATVGGNDAAKITTTAEGFDGVGFMVQHEAGILLVNGVTASGEAGDLEPIVLAVAESGTVEAPASE